MAEETKEVKDLRAKKEKGETLTVEEEQVLTDADAAVEAGEAE